MPDTPANQKEYPQLKTQKPGLGFPRLRLVVLLAFATAGGKRGQTPDPPDTIAGICLQAGRWRDYRRDMARATRILEGGLVYHVLNRGNGRRAFLHKPADFEAWLRVLAEAKKEVPMRVLAFCLMPNHFHLVLWPQKGEDLSRFVRWLSQTHTQRWHTHYHNVGTGHLYQGRFKAFPVQEDDHFYARVR